MSRVAAGPTLSFGKLQVSIMIIHATLITINQTKLSSTWYNMKCTDMTFMDLSLPEFCLKIGVNGP